MGPFIGSSDCEKCEGTGFYRSPNGTEFHCPKCMREVGKTFYEKSGLFARILGHDGRNTDVSSVQANMDENKPQRQEADDVPGLSLNG